MFRNELRYMYTLDYWNMRQQQYVVTKAFKISFSTLAVCQLKQEPDPVF